MILKEVARFHAASFHFVRTFPGGMEALRRELPLIWEGGMTGQFQTKNEQIML